MGAAYGTAKSGIGIAGVGTFRPDLIMKVRQRVLVVTIAWLTFGTTVSDSSRHGWNYSGLFSGHIGPDSWRPESASFTALQSF